MGEIAFPYQVDDDTRRHILIGHLVADHGATTDDVGNAADDLDALGMLHDCWDDEIEYSAHREEDNSVALVIAEAGETHVYTMPPETGFSLGAQLFDAARPGMSDKIDMSLFEGE